MYRGGNLRVPSSLRFLLPCFARQHSFPFAQSVSAVLSSGTLDTRHAGFENNESSHISITVSASLSLLSLRALTKPSKIVSKSLTFCHASWSPSRPYHCMGPASRGHNTESALYPPSHIQTTPFPMPPTDLPECPA
ncbi:hypothetical protein ABBQ32_012953 [Trebouxia sp. C0010 RCD-2024]